MTMNGSTETLDDLREALEAHADEPGPYSHNMVPLILGAIASRFSPEEAQQAIVDFDLDTLGLCCKREGRH